MQRRSRSRNRVDIRRRFTDQPVSCVNKSRRESVSGSRNGRNRDSIREKNKPEFRTEYRKSRSVSRNSYRNNDRDGYYNGNSAQVVNGSRKTRKNSTPVQKHDSSQSSSHSRSSRRSSTGRHTSSASSDSSRSSVSSSQSCSTSSSAADAASYGGQAGDIIDGRYRIIRELGNGTFGKVLECATVSSNSIVAIKVIRAIEKYVESAEIEAEILENVCRHQRDFVQRDHYCVDMYSHFFYLKHYCLVFEPLGLSIYEFLKGNHYIGFSPSQTCQITLQLLRAVEFLHSKIELVHTDIKPENLVLTSNNFINARYIKDKDRCRHHPNHSCGHCSDGEGGEVTCRVPTSTRIKLIDFGGATYFNDRHKNRVINTRQYRSPEVLLEAGWDETSDMWSIGCVAIEILTGDVLFDVHNNQDHLTKISEIIDQFPSEMIQSSRNASNYSFSHHFSHDLERIMSRDSLVKNSLYFGRLRECVHGLMRMHPNHRLKPKQAISILE